MKTLKIKKGFASTRRFRRGGFTLIEMIVAVGLFAVVMLLVTGIYLEIIAVTRQTQAVASATDNLSYALQNMARAIRTGGDYDCNGTGAGNATQDCLLVGGPNNGQPGQQFGFQDINGCIIRYYLSNSRLYEDVTANSINCTNAGLGQPLTDGPPDITIQSIGFFAQGTGGSGGTPPDYLEPQAMITVSGQINAGAGKNLPFTFETGATSRQLDL